VFAGIAEEVGTVRLRQERNGKHRIEILTPTVLEDDELAVA
jgi:hypothetical protein